MRSLTAAVGGMEGRAWEEEGEGAREEEGEAEGALEPHWAVVYCCNAATIMA